MRDIMVLSLIGLMLSGCAVIDWIRPDPVIKHEVIEVKVPVVMKAKPPEVLTVPLKLDLPVFVAPTSEGASSALTVQGEAKMKRLLVDLHDKERAWREWSK